jgi:hypothetical protein
LSSLIEALALWPPLLVHKGTMTVVDGLHRLEAARRLSLVSVRARFVEGSLSDAWLEALRENVRHGLPLTLLDRRRAANALLTAVPAWSDARIAQACGLSRRSIGNLRRSTSGAESREPRRRNAEVESRVGLDGRRRPVEADVMRERISDALREDPGASLRTIARRVGASAETVRSVRNRMAQETPPSTEGLLALGAPVKSATLTAPRSFLSEDSACRSTEAGRAFAGWFDSLDVDEASIARYADVVPLSRVYAVVDEAERRARAWKSFADILRDRTATS